MEQKRDLYFGLRVISEVFLFRLAVKDHTKHFLYLQRTSMLLPPTILPQYVESLNGEKKSFSL